MNPQTACNYALLQFLPYPETGEFVNVGVLVACTQPSLLHFQAERAMPARVKAMFPRQNEKIYAEVMQALLTDMQRAKEAAHNPKTCQLVFGELVRRRESVFRFGEIRTILTDEPLKVVEELFSRYVRMETKSRKKAELLSA